MPDHRYPVLHAGPRVPLPDEWVLRELPRLDLDDPQTYVSLYKTYGPLLVGVGDDVFGLLPREVFDSGIVDAQTDVVGWAKAFVQSHSQQAPEREPDQEDLVWTPELLEKISPLLLAVSLTVLRHHLELLRALIAHVKAYQRKRPLAKAWGAVSFFRPPENATEAWWDFENVMNAALRPFSVHVMTTKRVQFGDAPLYSIAALQIFNVLVEGLPVLTCANERCRRDFQRQLGRAAKGQYRTSGVMFCSHQCADAQRQRDRRRQQRKRQR